MNEKPRYTWIDYAKFISIFLVVSYHTPPRITGYIGEIIRQLRMPAFFLISGYLFNKDKFPTFKYFIKHRSIQLLIPYTSFFIIFYILWLIFKEQLGGEEDLNASILQPIYEFIYGNPTIVVAPYWFICCLFSMQIIHFLMLKYIPRKYIFPICCILPFLNCITDVFHYFPWNIYQAINYIPFYAFAYQYKDYLKNINKLSTRISIQAFFFLITTFYLTKLDNQYLVTLLFTLSGIFILPGYILFCKSLSNIFHQKHFIEFIGKNTIIVLALQNYVIGVIKILTFHFYGLNYFEGKYILNLIISFLVILIISIPIIIINRYFPFIIGRGKYFQLQLQNHETCFCNKQST